MRIGLDTSPLTGDHALQHRVRGVGFYTEHLKNALINFFPENTYVFTPHSNTARIDVLHIPYFEPFFFTLPFFKKYPTVVTIHDLTPIVFPKNFPSGMKGTVKWNIQKRLLHNVDAIIADSESSKKDIIKFIPIQPKKVHVVYLASGNQFKQVANE